jgi:hypothetical protein
MKQALVDLMRMKAIEIAKIFSDPKRGFNTNNETFKLDRLIPLSEFSVAAIYLKNTNKYVLFYLQYIQTGNGGFIQYHCVKYQHLEDYEKMKIILHEIEKHNFNVKLGKNSNVGN